MTSTPFKPACAAVGESARRPGASGKLRERIVDISGTVFRPLAILQQIDDSSALSSTRPRRSATRSSSPSS
jgi:hypothetical protein